MPFISSNSSAIGKVKIRHDFRYSVMKLTDFIYCLFETIIHGLRSEREREREENHNQVIYHWVLL